MIIISLNICANFLRTDTVGIWQTKCYRSIKHISGTQTSNLLGYLFVQSSGMAVAGVKNVEIPRVANLSPERFHRLEKETMEKGVQNVIFGDLLRDCKR